MPDLRVDDHVVHDDVQAGMRCGCDRRSVDVQQLTTEPADPQRRAGRRRLEPETVGGVLSASARQAEVEPLGRQLGQDVVDADQQPEVAHRGATISERCRDRRLPGARRAVEDAPLCLLRPRRIRPCVTCGRRDRASSAAKVAAGASWLQPCPQNNRSNDKPDSAKRDNEARCSGQEYQQASRNAIRCSRRGFQANESPENSR